MKFFGLLFYGLLLAQLLASLCIVGLSNRKIMLGDDFNSECPDGMERRGGAPPWEGCITNALAEEHQACLSRRLQLGYPGADIKPERNMWEAMEENAQVPGVILAVTLVLVPLWMLALRKCTAGVVYTSLFLDLAMLVYLVIRTEGAIPFIIMLVLFLAACAFAWHKKMLHKAIEILHITMVGLCETPQVFGACFLIFYLYVSYTIVWMLGLLASPNVLAVYEGGGFPAEESTEWSIPSYGRCELHEASVVANLRSFLILMFPITTLFFMNAKMVVCACGLGSWYFKGEETQPKSPAYVGLRWAFFESSGPVFAASLIMEGVRRLRRLAMKGCFGIHWACDTTCCGCCMRMIWCCFGQMLAAFSRFMLVAHVFHGGGVVTTGKNAYATLKNHLGQAVVTDTIATRVTAWSTTIFSAGLGIASWIWMETELGEGWLLQFISGAGETSAFLQEIAVVCVIVLEVWVVSMPVFSLTILGLVGSMVELTLVCGMLTGFFVGCITNVVFTFVGEIVHNSSDTIMYCYALESEAGTKQERFQDMYKMIKGNICEGVPEGDVSKVVEGKQVTDGSETGTTR